MALPSQLELRVGETYLLRLASLSTAGYLWSYTLSGEVGAIVILSDRATPAEQATVGTSTDEQWAIVAQQPGQVTLHLKQHRPWETDRPPLKQYDITIDIKP